MRGHFFNVKNTCTDEYNHSKSVQVFKTISLFISPTLYCLKSYYSSSSDLLSKLRPSKPANSSLEAAGAFISNI